MVKIDETMTEEDREELIGSLIDVVEDWLEEKGFSPADFPDGCRQSEPDEALIFGSDYDRLADGFATALDITRFAGIDNVLNEPLLVRLAGKITFSNQIINVYNSLDKPLFLASDVADIFRYSDNIFKYSDSDGFFPDDVWRMIQKLEKDEVVHSLSDVDGTRQIRTFITEYGLYNVLSQSNDKIARQWRRIIFEELFDSRRTDKKTVIRKFEEWNSKRGE